MIKEKNDEWEAELHSSKVELASLKAQYAAIVTEKENVEQDYEEQIQIIKNDYEE